MSKADSSLLRTKILIVIAFVAAVIFISGRMFDAFWLKMITKPIPVLMMALYLLLLTQKRRLQWIIFIGLLLGATGDILLEYSSDTFLLGLIAFLLGHLAYIIAFLSDCRRPHLRYAFFAYIYGIVIYGLLYQMGNLGDMKLPVLIYVLVITTMVWRAAVRLQSPAVNKASSRAGFWGALLFLLSDSLLAINLFLASFPLAGVIVIITYWLGQLGITLAAAKARAPFPGKDT